MAKTRMIPTKVFLGSTVYPIKVLKDWIITKAAKKKRVTPTSFRALPLCSLFFIFQIQPPNKNSSRKNLYNAVPDQR
jgi:hypothetical protein